MSKFYPIIRLERSDGKVRHVLREAGGEDSRDYFDVRCAVVRRPLFGIILGEEAYDKHYFDQQAPGILRLLDEYQEPGMSINSFLDRLSDSMILHGALAAYGETGDKDKAFVGAWWAYCDKRRLRLDLLQAPFADNFNLLSGKVQDSINSGLLRLERTSDTAQDLQGFATADLWPNIEAGNAAFGHNYVAEAERTYRSALDQSPNHAAALYYLAELLYQGGRVTEAINAMELVNDHDYRCRGLNLLVDWYLEVGNLVKSQAADVQYARECEP